MLKNEEQEKKSSCGNKSFLRRENCLPMKAMRTSPCERSLRRLNIHPTTIYLYFKDKADLLDSVCKETLLNLLNTLEELKRDTSDPVETLRKSGRAYVEFGLEYPQDYKLTFVTRPQFQKGLGLDEGSVGEMVFDYLRGMVSECIEQKILRQADVETTGQVMWSAVHGITLLLIDFPDFPWTEKDKLIDTVIHTTIKGLKA